MTDSFEWYCIVRCIVRHEEWVGSILYCIVLHVVTFLVAKLAKKCVIALIINVFNLYLSVVILSLLKFRKFCPTRPERAEAPSPGHRPGLLWAQNCRPVRAKALKLQAIHKAFALTGRLADCYYTQGDALG